MGKRLLALALIACLLTGMAMPGPEFGDFGGYGVSRSPARSAEQCAYGSAGLLGWPSVLVSVYLDESNGAAWDEDEIARSRQQLALAIDWITAQCAAYHAAPRFYYDDGTPDSDLFYHRVYNGRFAGGTDSDESERYYEAVEALCAELDTEALHRRYGTASVGFLFFLPLDGCAFTMVHMAEDGADYYHEYCTLYQYDAYVGPDTWDTPAVYAHEILHLYGAADLYEESEDVFMTPQLARKVAELWPDAIMYDSYGADDAMVYDRIDKTLCPLTAYRLGLAPRPAALAAWPDISAVPPGLFTYDLAGAAALTFEDGAAAA